MVVAVEKAFEKVVVARQEEIRPLLLSFAYFFFVLSSNFILRPIRDEMGVAGGVKNLAWLFTGTLVFTLIANPIFASLVVKLPVKKFISISYRFLIANLFIFYLLLLYTKQAEQVWIGRAFFIWVSVFNLFAVSIFWGFMADNFKEEQGRRLFGFIGLGGTIGSVFGSFTTTLLAEKIGTVNLLLISMLLLELAVWCVKYFPTVSNRVQKEEIPIGGTILNGFINTSRSTYLIGICVYMLLFTIGSTFLYFQQADIVGKTIADRATRTAFLARIDLYVNLLTVIVQLFLSGRLLKLLGVTLTLIFLPLISILGFATLGLFPLLPVVVVFQVVRRAGNFAIANPAREVLFTVISREDKYKAKNLIDTFIYRAGDQVGAWTYTLFGFLKLSISGIAFAAVPVAAIWLFVSLWLGRKQKRLVQAQSWSC